MKSIFFITVMNSKIVDSRRWGWYETLEDAEKVVLENESNIFENYYDYAVIEEMPEGALACSKNEWWYLYKNDMVSKCKKPKKFFQVCNFCLG